MKPLAFSVLRLLADGEFHSGSVIAARLGISRASVLNAVREAERHGIDVHHVHGRGYRVPEPVDWLDARTIAQRLGSAASRFDLQVLDSVDSTSTALLAAIERGAPSGTVIAAEVQTAGRGRLGRTWHAEPGRGLTFSLAWRFPGGAGSLSGLSLAAGLAVASGIAGEGVPGVGLKWPNDLVAGGAKLGGILIEVRGDALGPTVAVVGIGINVRAGEAIRGRVDQPAVAVSDLVSPVPDRNRLLAGMLAQLAATFDAFAADGFAPLAEAWLARDALRGSEIGIEFADGSTLAGIAAGVDGDGALLVDAGDGRRRIVSGELKVRARRAAAHGANRGGTA